MTRYVIKRLLMTIPVMLGVILIAFVIRAITPGDPVDSLLPEIATLEQREALREDRRWIERMELLEPRLWYDPEEGFYADLRRVLSREEYDLLHKLYLEGWSYKELCEELGEKKSTLAMRVKRSKEKIQKYL